MLFRNGDMILTTTTIAFKKAGVATSLFSNEILDRARTRVEKDMDVVGPPYVFGDRRVQNVPPVELGFCLIREKVNLFTGIPTNRIMKPIINEKRRGLDKASSFTVDAFRRNHDSAKMVRHPMWSWSRITTSTIICT